MSDDRLPQVLESDFFQYLLDLEIQKAVRYLYFFSLFVIQSDRKGAGGRTDQEESITKTVAQLIRDEIRETDVVGRVGRDRFFVILHQADFQQSREIGERILVKIRNYSFVISDQEVQRTVSIGAACFPTHANDMNGLVASAEQMLIK